jgi:hypothetical protein
MTNGADDGEQILELNPGTSKSPERPKLKILRGQVAVWREAKKNLEVATTKNWRWQ